MNKHPMDRRQASSGHKLRIFLGLDRMKGDGMHPALRALHQRSDTSRGDARLRQFLRIARGQSA